ncbi:sodium:calcium antiporter [Nanoarchaeota archaeon]
MIPIDSSPIVNFFLGLVAIGALVYSAEKIVDKILKISRHFGISELFLGITVISIGTSLAELTTTVMASIGILKGTISYEVGSGAILGTNVGSDLIQLTFITGIVAIFGVLIARKDFLKYTFSVMIAAEVLLLLFCLDGVVTRQEGFILFFGYLIYLIILYRRSKPVKTTKKEDVQLSKEIPLVLLGFLVLVIAANYILDISVYFVGVLGIGGSLIGALIIGVATALPEFATAMTGLIKRCPQVSLGTLVGSNITNPTMVVGLGALISTLKVPWPTKVLDLPYTIFSALIILGLFWSGERIDKKEAIFMISLYIIFIVIRLKFFAVD